MSTVHERPVILVEDNPRDREYLSNSLVDYTLKIAERGDQALEMFKQYPDAYLITDLQLPGLNGVDLSKAVWAINSTTRIVVWSQYNDEIYLRTLGQTIPAEALYGYVLKNNTSQVIQRAVHSVFSDEQCWIDPQLRPVRARNVESQSFITDAEYDVLVDIALGLTDNLIAERKFLSRRGVQSRLKSLYRKLDTDGSLTDEGINPRARAVALALNRGLINTYELDKAGVELTAWRESKTRRSQL